jgi:hypothetical protein
VFAGAAREAVFSKPEVIRRVNADFIPVALKAGLVNNPPGGDEGRLYREIGRSKPAPQGICVVNSAGKVLDWALMFDGDQSVLSFLDHCLKRFAKYPDAKQAVPAERYMKFPSAKLDDVEDEGTALPTATRHPPGRSCPGKPPLPSGTLVARVFGRALDRGGKPVADTVRQEHYVEDRFHVPVAMQEELATALADAGTKQFPIPERLARLLVSYAYLGQLDVNPCGAPGGKGDLRQCEFWGRKVADAADQSPRIRIEGRSDAAGTSGKGDGGDGRLWQHQVKLEWAGLIDMQASRITRLCLTARGSERLQWANAFSELKNEVDVAHLPAGHPIDLACAVRYGVQGDPAVAAAVGPAQPAVAIPEEARRQLTGALGVPFVIFRDKVQDELKLSDQQKQKMAEHLESTIQETMQFFQRLPELKPEQREKEMHAYRQKATEKLAAFLKDTLTAPQRQRLRQIELQQEGPFALGRPEIMDELKGTNEQRMKFMMIVQDMQKKMGPIFKEAQAKGSPDEIRPKILKVRKEYARKVEAVLTKDQRKQWQEMLGKQFDLGDE